MYGIALDGVNGSDIYAWEISNPMDEDSFRRSLDEVFKGQEQMKTNSSYSVNSFRGLAVAKSLQISSGTAVEGYFNRRLPE